MAYVRASELRSQKDEQDELSRQFLQWCEDVLLAQGTDRAGRALRI